MEHTDRFLVEMFHNYAFKESISVENLKLWLLILTKTLFLITILIKLTLGNIFIKVKKSARAAPLSQNSWYIFQMQITPLLRRPQGPQGCLEKQNCPLSSNLAVWCAKIGPKTQKLQETRFFLTFQLLDPILAHQTAKFELSGQFCFTRHPWGPWGRQSSGMKPKSADPVSVSSRLVYLAPKSRVSAF